MKRDGTRIIFEHADFQEMLDPKMDELHKLSNEIREEMKANPTEIFIPLHSGRLLGIPINCIPVTEKV